MNSVHDRIERLRDSGIGEVHVASQGSENWYMGTVLDHVREMKDDAVATIRRFYEARVADLDAVDSLVAEFEHDLRLNDSDLWYAAMNDVDERHMGVARGPILADLREHVCAVVPTPWEKGDPE